MGDYHNRRVVLVTGASSGIGRACATQLHQAGFKVYGTSRLPRAEPNSFEMIQMDVGDCGSVQRGVDLVWNREGQLDVTINNAGITTAGAVEDTSVEEAKSQFETNFFGAVRVCKAVLPLMRERRSGYIVNISSLAARISLPFQAFYSASKSALEGLSQALSMEVRPFGIHVVFVEPGDTHTQVIQYRRWVQDCFANPAYAESCQKALAVMERDEEHGAPPDRVARVVQRIINTRSPRLRYVVASPFESAATILRSLLPYRFFEWLVIRYYRLA